MQPAQPLLSSLHWKVELDSLEESEKLAAVEVVLAGGPPEIEVWGGVVSPGGGGEEDGGVGPGVGFGAGLGMVGVGLEGCQ